MAARRAVALAGALTLLASAAAAQPPPSKAERWKAFDELTAPTGVGGCVLRAIDPRVNRAVLEKFIAGARGIPPELPPAIAAVSAGCTGRPYAPSDTALVAAVLGLFGRGAGALDFGSRLGIGQHRLDAAWLEASPEEKAPFLRAGADFVDPKSPTTVPTTADAQPLARRLNLDSSDDPAKLLAVQRYYMATALSEAGEAKLASEGAKPTNR